MTSREGALLAAQCLLPPQQQQEQGQHKGPCHYHLELQCSPPSATVRSGGGNGRTAHQNCCNQLIIQLQKKWCLTLQLEQLWRML